MAYEQVGNGYSVGVIPNYAAEDEQIQQGLAHRFDQYTNPFLLAHSLSDVFQPGIQNAQKQQMVNIDQARQNLAATAQNTLLPLQANMLNAQATNLTGEAALRNYQLTQSQDAQSQLPDLLTGLSDAENSSDPSLLFKAGAAAPAAVARNPGLITDSLNRLSQQQAIKTQGITGSAMSQGMDYASQNPSADPSTFESAYKPTDGLNPAQQLQEKQAFIQGASHQQAQASVAAAKGQIQLAAAQIRQTGQIDAATQRALGPLIQKGFFTPDALAAAGVDPDTAMHLQAAISATPGANGSVVPDKTAVANLNLAKSILSNPAPTTIEKNWAYSTMNGNGVPAFQLPILPPAAQDQVDLLNSQIQNLQTSLPSRGTSSMFGQSDYDKTNAQITDLKKQVINIKNNNATAPTTPTQNGNVPAPAAGFGNNPFMKPIPAGQGQTSATPTPVVPGNPQTTAALAATGEPATPAAASAAAPPDAAIAKLRANPSLAPYFDQQFGKGQAVKYLKL